MVLDCTHDSIAQERLQALRGETLLPWITPVLMVEGFEMTLFIFFHKITFLHIRDLLSDNLRLVLMLHSSDIATYSRRTDAVCK